MPPSSLRHPLPPPSHLPSRDLHVNRSQLLPLIVSLSRAAGIARRDTKSRLKEKTILPYRGSSRITIRSSDLFGNLRTFHLRLRSSVGSLRIYFGSSVDLSDSSSILEIGPSSEILCIIRPFAHPVPFPLPLPSSRIPPSYSSLLFWVVF